MEPRSGFRITGQLVLGVAIAILGVLFTLDNLHILRARDFLRFWPLALIAVASLWSPPDNTPRSVMMPPERRAAWTCPPGVVIFPAI